MSQLKIEKQEEMNVEEYQKIIKQTAVFPRQIGIAYCGLGLTGEAGEVADKIKKLYRDKNLLESNHISDEDKLAIAKELGDVLWYLTATANELGIRLSTIMQMNYDKLIQRRQTNTLHGSGDDRETL